MREEIKKKNEEIRQLKETKEVSTFNLRRADKELEENLENLKTVSELFQKEQETTDDLKRKLAQAEQEKDDLRREKDDLTKEHEEKIEKSLPEKEKRIAELEQEVKRLLRVESLFEKLNLERKNPKGKTLLENKVDQLEKENKELKELLSYYQAEIGRKKEEIQQLEKQLKETKKQELEKNEELEMEDLEGEQGQEKEGRKTEEKSPEYDNKQEEQNFINSEVND